jgi:hypothetical protein
MTTKKASKKKVTKKKAAKKKTAAKKADEVMNFEDEREHLDVIEADAPQATYQVDLISANPEFQKFEIAKRIAHTLAQSNLVPDAYRGRPNDCFVAINMGAELGMEPFQAIQSIAVIDGKPCLYGDGLIGVVRASSKCEWIQETISEDGLTATCTTQRKGDPKPISASYSMDNAVQAGIHTKFNWQKHPTRMLQMRARSYCLRDAYPDLLKGLGMVEEMQDHDDTPPPVTDYKLPEKEQPAESNPLLDQAREVFGDGVEEVTLSSVERAMHQSDSMADLLDAAKAAKFLSEEDQVQARITYKKMRTALLDTGEGNDT